MRMRVSSLIALAVVLPTIALGGKPKRQPATAPPIDPPASQPSSTPQKLVGKWMYGSVSPTTYWDGDTGVFRGNARGSAGIYEFDDAGRYKEYIYLELRTAGIASKAWTVHEGTVTFTADAFTLHVERGHYQFWTNDRQTTDRAMKPEECAKLSKTYAWRTERADEGGERFVVPFEDGSMMEYRRQ